MSYLNSPRLTFSGQFQADPSTVNNDPTHFNNATFLPNYQDYGKGATNGWWNPDGTGSWRFIGCTIKSVTYKDGTTTTDPGDDPIIGMSIEDANARVAGKIVDLDSQQQAVSMLWGLVVRITKDGKEIMTGDYEPAAFTNLYGRVPNLRGFSALSASYQSVIENISWNFEEFHWQNSRYLKELDEACPDRRLSIQFTVDRFNGNYVSSQFTLGRIVGSIGPSSVEEPNHFVLGRQLFPQDNSCNYAVAVVDENLSRITVDLGNSLQFDNDGKVVEKRDLALAIDKGADGYVYLGKIDYSSPDWYSVFAGISSFDLSSDNLEMVSRFPLVIVDYQTSQSDVFNLNAKTSLVFQESAEYVCADQFVFRLNPDEDCTVNFYSTVLGKPLNGGTIRFQLFSDALGPAPPDFATPTDILTFPVYADTDSAGKAAIIIRAADPGNPRGYIDGQVFGISYNLSDQQFQNCNQSNFLSLLVFDGVPEENIKNPTWEDIQPIMQQYANLYPLMSKGVFNLADKDVVGKNAEILKFVFSKDKNDPNYMPATRDLSRDKQQMILNYLDRLLTAKNTEETITTRKS